jgi:hypothetical protein
MVKKNHLMLLLEKRLMMPTINLEDLVKECSHLQGMT